jgi:hypothetical protein
MTQILERAFLEAQKLSDHEQDTLGAIIIEEMLDEFRWNEAFAKSQDVLAILADEAIAEFSAGKTTPLEF